jgi:hypothetical protein
LRVSGLTASRRLHKQARSGGHSSYGRCKVLVKGQEKRPERCSSLAHALFGYPSVTYSVTGQLLAHSRVLCLLLIPSGPIPEGLVIIPNSVALVKGFRVFFRRFARRISRPAFSSGGMWWTRLYRARQAWAGTRAQTTGMNRQAWPNGGLRQDDHITG